MRRSRKDESTRPLPSVNLLSPWVFDALATRTLRRRFIVAACMLGLAVGAGWAVQELRAAQAEQILVIEQAESSRLASQAGALAPVRAFVGSVEQQKKTVSETMRHEVYFSEVLDDLAMATPADAEVESISVTIAPPSQASTTGDPASGTNPAAGSVCPGPDPFNTRTVVGCITLSGSAAGRSAVGQLVVNLAESDLFVEPFISTTTTADGEQVTFTGSVGLSKQVFSHRYADLNTLLATGESR